MRVAEEIGGVDDLTQRIAELVERAHGMQRL
jgi:hypothetical protein